MTAVLPNRRAGVPSPGSWPELPKLAAEFFLNLWEQPLFGLPLASWGSRSMSRSERNDGAQRRPFLLEPYNRLDLAREAPNLPTITVPAARTEAPMPPSRALGRSEANRGCCSRNSPERVWVVRDSPGTTRGCSMPPASRAPRLWRPPRHVMLPSIPLTVADPERPDVLPGQVSFAHQRATWRRREVAPFSVVPQPQSWR